MDKFFYPKSVLVVGVSNKPTNMGRNIIQNLVDFDYKGEIYLLGREADEILGHKIHTSFEELPKGIDLAVFLLPARFVPDIMEYCGMWGITRVIIESSGFSELSDERKSLESRLCDIAKKYGIRFVGPNCLGIICQESGLAVPFMQLKPIKGMGKVSLIAQSGGVGMMGLGTILSENVGIDKFVSIGNMLNITANDILEYLKEKKTSDRICLYLETIKDGRKFFEVTKDYPVPILIQKSNVSSVGARMALSHTAAVANDDKIVDACFRQNGIIRVKDMQSLINYTKIFSLPPMKGDRLVIISRSGGHAVISADYAEKYNFKLPSFPVEILDKIKKYSRANVIRPMNPLDLGDLFDFDVYVRIIEEVLSSDWADGIVLNHVYASYAEGEASRNLIGVMGELMEKYGKPIAVCIFSEEEEIQRVKKMHRFPIFTTPEDTLRAMAISRDHHAHKVAVKNDRYPPKIKFDSPKIKTHFKTPSPLVGEGWGEGEENYGSHPPLNPLPSREGETGLEVLNHAGFKVALYGFASSVTEVEKIAKKIKGPMVLKIVAPGVTHKWDIGGVMLNIESPTQARRDAAKMIKTVRKCRPGTKVDGFLVQKMVEGRFEIFLGGKRDLNFGPVIMVGLGGTYVEVFKDIATRLVPVTLRDVDEMLSEVVSFRVLKGVRGEKPADIKFLKETIYRLSAFMEKFPEIKEIDINPLKLGTKGGLILDAKLYL